MKAQIERRKNVRNKIRWIERNSWVWASIVFKNRKRTCRKQLKTDKEVNNSIKVDVKKKIFAAKVKNAKKSRVQVKSPFRSPVVSSFSRSVKIDKINYHQLAIVLRIKRHFILLLYAFFRTALSRYFESPDGRFRNFMSHFVDEIPKRNFNKTTLIVPSAPLSVKNQKNHPLCCCFWLFLFLYASFFW